MLHVFTAVLVITCLSVLLAVVLVVADALLLDYGTCTITVNDDTELSVEGGMSLLAGLMAQGIFIPSACGGRGSCGLCKVKVHEGGGPLLPTEAPHLGADEIEQHVRIACQVKIRSDIAVEIPEDILSVREYEGVVEGIVDLNYDTKLVRIALREPGQMSFRAGQYVQFETPPYGKTPEPVYRAYSLAASPDSMAHVELIMNGICTTYVFEILREGDAVRFNGPYGDFYLRDTAGELIFVAGGSGIAPIRSILFQMVRDRCPRKATFFYGANELRDLYLVDEMHEFERELADFTYVPALARPGPEDAWEGETGLVTEVLDRRLSGPLDMEAYLCGSPAMIDATAELLTEKGLPQERIFFDKFA